MAKKTSLRDFQTYLAGRLSSAAQGGRAVSWLGLQAGELSWLIDLADSGEIIQSPQITPVPLTQRWFAGMANIRGNLFAVTDFSAFCGGRPEQLAANSRLLLVGSKFGSNAALLVTQMLGLRNPDDFTPAQNVTTRPAWGASCYDDRQGKRWHKLLVSELLADPYFMNIGA
jgi:twitching motility protein PilI